MSVSQASILAIISCNNCGVYKSVTTSDTKCTVFAVLVRFTEYTPLFVTLCYCRLY
jgi:hypothetical protein